MIKFYNATVLSAITNTNYEGEIKNQGDRVRVRVVPDITISDYKAGQTLTHQRPESVATELLIDKGKYFDVILDDVMAVQSDMNLMSKFAEDAGEQMKIAIDTDVLQNVIDDASADNIGATAGVISGAFDMGTTGSPVVLTKVNVIDHLIDMGTVLDEQNVPETGRYVVIPTWLAGMIKKSDLKDASLTGDSVSPIRNGLIGRIDRFDVFKSNLLKTSGSGYGSLFGQMEGITFASQITKVETLTAESTFGEILRGLNVYGYKGIKPEAFGVSWIQKG